MAMKWHTLVKHDKLRIEIKWFMSIFNIWFASTSINMIYHYHEWENEWYQEF
jgi:hypothetical protein